MIKVFNIAPNCVAVKATHGEGFVELFYSYDKLVAISFINTSSQERYRAQPPHSRITTRHLKKMGVYDWPLTSHKILSEFAENNIELLCTE